MFPEAGGSEPYFSVIVPTYDRPELLREALESVRLQTFTDFECLVVDDASPEAVVVPEDSRFSILRNQENGGAAVCRNVGMRNASGRVVAFLDDDDAWAATRLESAYRMHQEGAEVVFCGVADYVGTPQMREDARILEVVPWTTHMATMSVVAECCPLMDESFRTCEDTEWALRLKSSKPRVATVNRAELLWRFHEGPRHLSGSRERIAGLQQMLEKHRDHYAQRRRELADIYLRIGHQHYRLGERLFALQFAFRSMATMPSGSSGELIARCFLPRAVSWAALREKLLAGRAKLAALACSTGTLEGRRNCERSGRG